MNEDEIKQELLKRGIKLWKPPYYGVRHFKAALQSLAETWEPIQTTLPILQSFRNKALAKLQAKSKLLNELHLKVLLGKEEKDDQTPVMVTQESFPETWAEQITVTTPNTNSSAICLTLHRVNPDLTVETLSQQLIASLLPQEQQGSVRLVHKGKSLSDARLSDHATGMAKMLCLIQPRPSCKVPSEQGTTTDDQVLLDSIRTAASRLQQNNTRMEITDSAGHLVAMSPSDRLAFLTALGLHAVGQERRERDSNWSSALFFFLQADEEWSRLDDNWKDRVDNYGLLQLDICWSFLKLASLDNLPNVLERLANAEAQFRKQVHVNFVTLALVQAEQGNPVPPLSVLFVRLFLLQGVAYHYAGNERQSRERLDWAWALAKSLRAAAPPQAVEQLVQAGFCDTPSQAIVALRECNGNVDGAALCIQQKVVSAEQAAKDRARQHEYGLCQNGQDFVNLEVLQQLQSVLGLASTDESDLVASGLLRLADNQLERAIDLYQECMRDPATVLHRVAQLDQSQGRRRKRTRDEPVDEMALASLVSMGVEEAVARRALAANENNVEMALLYVTTTTDPSSTSESTAVAAASAGNESSDESNDSGNESSDESNDDDSEDVSLHSGSADSDAEDDEGEPSETTTSRRVTPTPQEVAEQEAIELLERVLGQALQKQHHDEGCLGNSLDEEWGYIEQYRGET